tara:strand:+ start:616 stop:852 length:237 start_codon:yes stop_codon:yes gene_type:complete
MKLSNQALGALMMALQKSLMEQSDIVPVLLDMNFQVDPGDTSQSTLIITNPPVVSLEGTDVTTTETTTTEETDFNVEE